MSTRNLLFLLVPLVIAAGFLLAMSPSKSKDDSVVSSPVHDAEVQQLVEQFGDAMKNVSLLAPNEQLRAEMQAAFGMYATPELIETWLADPSRAPGRQVSSPWPARINVGSMQEAGETFVVNGTVIEVVHENAGVEEIVGTYPVALGVEKRNGVWQISVFEKGPYSQIPSRARIVGTYTCLPHRDTSGPQTMECAFGVREESSGEHYAINTQLMSSLAWMEIPTGARIEVEGVMTPLETLSADYWQKYDIVGIISATRMERL